MNSILIYSLGCCKICAADISDVFLSLLGTVTVVRSGESLTLALTDHQQEDITIRKTGMGWVVGVVQEVYKYESSTCMDM